MHNNKSKQLTFDNNGELDQLLLSLDQLTENLPDFKMAATTLEQPYHTRSDSKPFSYYRTNNNNNGLESPNVLRRIMGMQSSSNGSELSQANSVISRGSSPGATSAVSREVHSSLSMSEIESASLTWLERQQKKLAERRAAQRRRDGGGMNGAAVNSDLLRDLKTSLERARSETTTASYADTNSTRESSPLKPLLTSTPAAAKSPAAPSLTPLVDRARPLIQRRLRYDSETSNEDGSLSGRPITPAFPPPTPTFNRSVTSSRRGSLSSEPADVAPSNVQLAKDNYKFWYKPHITREEAIALLRPHGPGTFVVRDSNSFPGAFGLALKVATPPEHAPPSEDELIRHFLVEPTSKGVKLKGYSNEPVFASLSALVYQHTVTPLALPTRLVLPARDLSAGGAHVNGAAAVNGMQQLLALGAACNVLYLFSLDTDSLTGPNAVKKAVSQLMLARPRPHAALVHFKVSGQGITLTDHGRKLFFRKHYNTASISFCGIDPEDRRWAMKAEATSQRIFGFVASKKGHNRGSNQCHLFAEQDPEQPARAIVNFVNKILLNSGSNSRSDVV